MPTLMFINKESLDAIADKVRDCLGEASTYKLTLPAGFVKGVGDSKSAGKDEMLGKKFTSFDVRDETYKRNGFAYGPYAFAGNTNLVSAALNGNYDIPDYCFLDCTSLEDVKWYNSTNNRTYRTVKGKGAFKGCTSLESISLAGSPIGNEIISDDAFYGCTALENVSFVGQPNTYTTIGNNAFRGCSSLTSFTFGSYLRDIGQFAFANTGLTSVSINMRNGTRLSVGANAFDGCTDLTTASIAVGSGKTGSLGNYCFRGCTSLETVTLSEGITSIPFACFTDCHSLRSIHIPASVTSIGDYAFQRCTSLTEVIFDGNPSLISIGQRAFEGCTSLVNFTVPASVTSIGAYAFSSCDSLEYTRLLPTTPPTAGQYIFYTTINNPMTIYVPASEGNVVYDAYYNATNWKISSYRSRMAVWPES